MHLKEDRLREKGWSEDEIKHTRKLVNKIKRTRQKHPHNKLLGETIYWFLVGVIIASIVATAYWILPLVLFLPTKVLYPMIIIIGLSFGMFLWIIVKDLDHLEAHHHAIISILIPIAGLLSFSIILGNYAALAQELGTEIHATIITIIFICSYSAPYAYHLHDKHKKKK